MLVNPNGTGLVTVAKTATNPDWSPDRRRLVYQSVRNGDSDLWTVNVDGSGSKEITYSVGEDGDPRGRRTARRSRSSRTGPTRAATSSSSRRTARARRG